MIKIKMPTQQSVNSPALTQLRYGTGRPASESTYQIEPRSPPRSLLYTQKLRHASGASSSTRRLARPQLTRKVDKVHDEVAHPFASQAEQEELTQQQCRIELGPLLRGPA